MHLSAALCFFFFSSVTAQSNRLLRKSSSHQDSTTTTEDRDLSWCSREKKVQIYKFCIDGDDDAGAYGEHQLRLDGHKYYPNSGNDCPQDPSGYCEWREGQCHNLRNAPWKKIKAYKSLTVGTEEHDTWSENDSYTAFLTANDWYSPTCEPYEVRIYKQFESANKKSVCWDVGASKNDINAGIQSCSEWTEPAESYVWFMKVEPIY